VMELPEIRNIGLMEAATTSLQKILSNGIAGFWIHLDADVLNDAIMPAVDYRMPDGLSFDELI